MPELTHRIDHLYADALRLATAPSPDDVRVAAAATLEQTGSFYLPFALEQASGRARCRACGNKIPRDSDVISFGYDPSPVEGGPWGKLVTAYIHATFCPPEGAQEKGDEQ